MSRKGMVLFAVILLAVLALPQGAPAADEDIQKKVDALSKEVQSLQQQVDQSKEGKKSISDWLTIGGDYRFRIDSLRGEAANFLSFSDYMAWAMGGMVGSPAITPATTVKNETLYTNRFGLDITAKVMKDVTFHGRLLMYKAFGSQTNYASSGDFFADRIGVFDGTLGHVPSSGGVAVDQVYMTINNIFDQPIWFSIGRRPSTGGIPTHLRQDNEKPGVSGVSGLLVDYAYDGLTLGYAPDIDSLPGAYAKFCYGRGYQSGFTSGQPGDVKNMDMMGFVVVPYDTNPLSIHLQFNHAMNIIDFPDIPDSTLGPLHPTTNLGDIDQFGIVAMSTLKKVGPGTLNLFASGAMDKTHPNDNHPTYNGMLLSNIGLMYTGTKESTTGNAVYIGARYDLPSKTMIGFEYNHGSKNWISFVPAADDMWTSKLGTRGDVYEGYVIQELGGLPIASYHAKTFVRIGYQYYDFKYTGSNNWVGGPVSISDVASNPQLLTPLKNAKDLYATLEVKF
jgi:outer membrane murein-binding lipoprotein Lpp